MVTGRLQKDNRARANWYTVATLKRSIMHKQSSTITIPLRLREKMIRLSDQLGVHDWQMTLVGVLNGLPPTTLLQVVPPKSRNYTTKILLPNWILKAVQSDIYAEWEGRRRISVGAWIMYRAVQFCHCDGTLSEDAFWNRKLLRVFAGLEISKSQAQRIRPEHPVNGHFSLECQILSSKLLKAIDLLNFLAKKHLNTSSISGIMSLVAVMDLLYRESLPQEIQDRLKQLTVEEHDRLQAELLAMRSRLPL